MIPDKIMSHLYLGSLDVYRSRNHHNFNFEYAIDLSANENPEVAAIPNVLKFNIADSPDQDISFLFLPCIRFIEHGRNSRKNVFVNCYAGISRSTTIILAYLMYLKALGYHDKKATPVNLNEALQFVRSRRSIINPNPGFITQLLNWQSKLNNRKTFLEISRLI
jgi:atypical dual specificity phosphatase